MEPTQLVRLSRVAARSLHWTVVPPPLAAGSAVYVEDRIAGQQGREKQESAGPVYSELLRCPLPLEEESCDLERRVVGGDGGAQGLSGRRRSPTSKTTTLRVPGQQVSALNPIYEAGPRPGRLAGWPAPDHLDKG